jgi:hypothetical protein
LRSFFFIRYARALWLHDGASGVAIRDNAVEQHRMLRLMMRIARRMTSTEEVFRVIPSEHLLLEE